MLTRETYLDGEQNLFFQEDQSIIYDQYSSVEVLRENPRQFH